MHIKLQFKRLSRVFQNEIMSLIINHSLIYYKLKYEVQFFNKNIKYLIYSRILLFLLNNPELKILFM